MEAFRPPFAAEILPDSVERLPFDIVRTLAAARQAATPTAHLLAGRGAPRATETHDPADGLMRLMLGARFADAGDPLHGARFAACTIGRVTASTQEVSA